MGLLRRLMMNPNPNIPIDKTTKIVIRKPLLSKIKDLSMPRIFNGLYRVTTFKVLRTSTGKKYMRLQLDDSSGSITAYIWDGQYHGPWSFESMGVVEVKGRSRYYNGEWVVDLKEASAKHDGISNALSLLPFSKCPVYELLPQLIKVESMIQNTALKSMLSNIFLDMGIAIPFMTVPGSLKHHHNEPGGLMKHSIECAQIASNIELLNDEQRDLAIVGALLHDMGKIRVFNDMTRTSLGYLVDHQALTLEVCAQQIRSLEQAWPDGAFSLRHMLTCTSIKRWGYKPRMAIAHIVQLADKLSVELDMEKRSFKGIPANRNVSLSITNDNQSYWRPLMMPPMSDNFGRLLSR